MKNSIHNWQIKTLGEVCDVIGGGTPSKANSKYYDGEIPWATVRDLKYDVVEVTEHRITKEAIKNSSTNIIPKGNVIIATRVGLGKVCLIKQDTAINQDLRGIVPKNPNEISVRYLFRWLKSVAHLIEKEGTGATVQGVKLPFIKSLLLPLSPLPEQKRIVKILDEVFDGVAKAKTNAEKNLQNARELFESYLQSVFAHPGKDWEEKKLGDFLDIKHGFAFKSEYFSNCGEYVLLTPGNFYEKGGYRDRGEKQKYYIGVVFEDFVLNKNDLLIAMTEQAEGLLGSPAIIPESCKFLHNQRLGLILYKDKNYIETKFLFYLFNTERIRSLIHESASGVKVRHTSPSKVLAISVSLPPLAEQRAIVAKLDALSAETKKLEAIYQQKLDNLEELKKSVLKKAFSGEL